MEYRYKQHSYSAHMVRTLFTAIVLSSTRTGFVSHSMRSMIKASGESRLETGKARLPPSLKTLSLNHNAHCFVYAILDTNLEDVAIAIPYEHGKNGLRRRLPDPLQKTGHRPIPLPAFFKQSNRRTGYRCKI